MKRGSEGNGVGKASLLTQFRPELFVSHDPWRNLERILRNKGGGSYGLAGPRGAGKTWMMERALREADEEDGIGVWFPSPSEYEPTAFIAALSDVVAAQYQRYYDNRTRRATRVANNRLLRNATIAVLLMLFALALLGTREPEYEYGLYWLNTNNLVWGIPFFVGLYLLMRAFVRYFQEQRGLGRVRSEAEELRRQVRYAISSSEQTELGLDGGYAGIGARLKRARERKLVERPATLSSLIHNFRSFAEAMADEVKGPTIIAIDELDKMSDPARVAQLFRDIKGIFDIPKVYFLVSLSDEAARALDLGGVRARNEFNSSFYTVVSLPRLSPEQCVQLLRRRDPEFDESCGLAIGVLSGGVSREVARLGEIVRAEQGPSSVKEVFRITMEEELNAFGSQVLSAENSDGESPVSTAAQVAFFEQLDHFKNAIGMEVEAFSALCRRGWEINANCPGWRSGLEEEWRRILVRLAVAWFASGDPSVLDDPAATLELQSIVRTGAESAAVGRSSLERFLRREGRLKVPEAKVGRETEP